ncbi:MAG: helix-turn-helix domain-containing protein [Chloroflexota bacterium]|nr:helix-turn-helix domain-containing protein [Chloroflexota bacterium]
MEPCRAGVVLREIREEQNISVEQASALTGVSSSFIRKLENGQRRDLMISIAMKLAVGLGVNLTRFVEEVDQDVLTIGGAVPSARELGALLGRVQGGILQLERRAAGFQMMADAASQPMFLHDGDHILFVNKAVGDLLGEDDPWTILRKTNDIGVLAEYIVAEDVPFIFNRLHDPCEDPFQVTIVRSDGVRIPLIVKVIIEKYRGKELHLVVLTSIKDEKLHPEDHIEKPRVVKQTPRKKRT